MNVTFHAHGTPASKGSKNATVRGGRAIMYEASSKKLGPWMRAVKQTAGHALIGMGWKLDGPMGVRLRFFLRRPAAHHVGGKRHRPLRSDAPHAPTAKGRNDIDKLTRGVLDALTGIAWDDDGQVYSLTATKDYADDPGCQITIERAQ